MTIWKNTCAESWQDTIENGWEVSGKPGAFLFFIPKGRTYSPPAKAGGGSPPVGRARALSEGGLRLLREPLDDATARSVLLSSPTQTVL